MFKRRRKYEQEGFKPYEGNAKNICEQIVRNCYNKKENYFMTSLGHFCEYWSRDFGLCVESLKKLGYEKEIKSTLNYALNIFQKKGKITTTINPKGKPFDFPTYAPDSLGFTLHSLVTLNDKELVEKHKSFLEKEVKRYYKKVINKKTGLVKKKHFSSMKDLAKRKSSCYDNIMSGWISKNLDLLGLNNPLKKYDFKKLILDNFWTGTHFIDDLSGSKILSGDANTYSFWTKLFEEEDLISSAISKVQKKGLDKPFPIKYSIEKPKTVWYDLLSSGYEFQSIWAMTGIPFIKVVLKVDEELAKKYFDKYTALIEEHKTFLEVYEKDGSIFKRYNYVSDEAMLWASMYLELDFILNKNS